MKKFMICTLVFSTLALAPLVTNSQPILAADKTPTISESEKHAAQIELQDATTYDPTSNSLKRLKSIGASFSPAAESPFKNPFAAEPTKDSEATVSAAEGTGLDSDGNEVQLNISKGSVLNQYYLDNTVNSDRISSVNHTTGSMYLLSSILAAGLRISAFSSDMVTSTNTNFNDSASVTGADQFQKNHDFFVSRFSYDGMDNGEAALENNIIGTNAVDKILDVDFTFNAANLYLDNAKTSYTIFGKGGTISNGDIVYTFGRMDDDRATIAHEYSHGVVRSLVNFGNLDTPEKGGLNEGLPDVFAAAISGKWEMGTNTLNVASDNTSFRRNLSDPSMYYTPGTTTPYPSKYSDLSEGMDSHYAGSVIGHQYYLLTEGGDYNGIHSEGIGTDKSIQIVFKSLSLMPDAPEFAEYRMAMEQAATDLYGADSDELAAVKTSMDATEMPTN